MPFRSSHLLVLALSLAWALYLAPPAHAAERAASELVIVQEDDSVSGDLYAAGARVIVEGVVEGDLVAFAAEDVTVTGEVTGDVLVVAPDVEVSGVVGGSLRAVSSGLSLSGRVGGDLVAVGWRADLDSGSLVSGDVLAWAVTLDSRGTIGGDLLGTQRVVRLAGRVDGGVDVTVNHLSIVGPLEVGDDLGYRSAEVAAGVDQAVVGGVVVHKMPLPPNIRVRALGLLIKVLSAVTLTATALLVAWGWPERTDRAARLARSRTLRAAGFGSLLILSPVLLVVVAAVIAALAPPSASFPLLVAFLPLILATFGMVVVLSVVAGTPAALAVGRLVSGRLGLYGAVVAGSALGGVVWLLPWVGWLVPLLFLPVGLGAWMLTLRSPPAKT